MVQRIKIGQQKDGKYGLRISKAGYDVDNVTDPKYNENLVFNSDWEGVLPLHMSGTLGSGGSIAHGLGYIPFISAMVNIGGRGWEQYVSLNYGPRVMSKVRRDYASFPNSTPSPTTGSPTTATAAYDFPLRPQNRYAFQEDRAGLDTCRIYADTGSLYFTCSSAASAYYMIYRWKAF